MLKSMRLRNLRAFADTEEVQFSALNVFIGPNNAGKTTFTSGIELLLRSLRISAGQEPLALAQMPSFASFDAAVRRHWSRNENRPTQIKLNYQLQFEKSDPIDLEFVCEADSGSSASVVTKASYSVTGRKATLIAVSKGANVRRYRGTLGNKKFGVGSIFFQGIWPVFSGTDTTKDGRLSFQLFGKPAWYGSHNKLEVVKPFRPLPRSYYVLDDPSIEKEERELVTYLANLWDADDQDSKSLRSSIAESLRALGLTTTLEVIRTTQKRGPKILEIRVAPHSTRQKVTIADAGFGLSQALPLVVSDARLNGGSLIAYQPEVHLHPYAQSRLADLFALSVARRNQIFVESHSPDLVLRLQILVAEGKLDADDVSIFCFENKKGKPAITKVTFDSNAKPSVPWPSGFLDTSLTLARELAGSRMRKARNS